MKQFTCQCAQQQFKNLDQVFLDFTGEPGAEMLCVYRPKEKVTLRRVKLDVNYCPNCGKPLHEI